MLQEPEAADDVQSGKSELRTRAEKLLEETETLRGNKPEEASHLLLEAATLFEKAGEKELAANTFNELVPILEDLNDFDGALHASLELLRLEVELNGPADHPDTASTLNQAARCYSQTGFPHKALDYYRKALVMRERLYPGDHHDVATSLNNVALALKLLSRYEEALPLYEKSLAMFRRLYPEDHMRVAMTESNLASCLRALLRPHEALPHYKAASDMMSRLHDEDPSYAAKALNGVAMCLESLGHHEEALEKHEEALSMIRSLHEEPHPSVAQALDKLGMCLHRLGRFQEALPKFEEALEIVKLFYGENRPERALSLNNLGYCLISLGREVDALQKFEEALAVLQRSNLGKHQNVFRCLNNVAYLQKSAGLFDQALLKYEEALEMAKVLFKSGHPDISLISLNMSECLRSLGRPSEALEIAEKALSELEQFHAGDHPDVAKAERSVASCERSRGRPAEALPKFRSTFEMWKRLFPGDHPDTATAMTNLGLCFYDLGRFIEALPWFEAALAMDRRLYLADHPSFITSMNNVAACLERLGRSEEALPIIESALQMAWSVFKNDHPEILTLMNNLANCFQNLGRLDDALKTYESSLAMGKRIYKNDANPNVIRTLTNTGTCLRAMNRLDKALQNHEKALSLFENLYPKGHPNVVVALNNVAAILVDLQRFEEALLKYEKALLLAREFGSPEVYMTICNLGALHVRMKRFNEGCKLFTEAVNHVEEVRSRASVLEEWDRAAYFDRLRSFEPYHGLGVCLLHLGDPLGALQVIEQGRGRSLLDLLERSQIDPLERMIHSARNEKEKDLAEQASQIREETREADRRIIEKRRELRRVIESVSSGRRSKDSSIEQTKVSLKKALEERRALGRKRARLVSRNLKLARSATSPELQGFLQPDERMLFFSFTKQDGLIFLVRPTGQTIEVFHCNVGHEVLEKSVQDILAAVDRGHGSRSWADQGAKTKKSSSNLSWQLFTTLFPEKLWVEIQTSSRTYIIPDGALHRIPFELLVIKEPGKEKLPVYWLDEGPSLVYSPSGSLLLRCKEQAAEKRNDDSLYDIVALGDPDFQRRAQAPDLPESGALVMAVKPDSHAEKAGIQPGDVVLNYCGEVVEDAQDLGRRIMERSADRNKEADNSGSTARIDIWRCGETLDVTVNTGSIGILVAPGRAREAWQKGYGRDAATDLAVFERSACTERYGDLRPLPGSRDEVLSIFKTFTNEEFSKDAARRHDHVRILLGQDANERILLRETPRTRILHMATHGIMDETELVAHSALALTPPENLSEEDDGFLRVSDLFEKWRRKLTCCDLVVLSACETQKGPMQRAEGIFSLPWGFLYAGAPSLIATQWRVNDRSTAELMSEFYRLLRSTDDISKLDAFTQARKWLKKSNPDPYYWAPFVFIGRP